MHSQVELQLARPAFLDTFREQQQLLQLEQEHQQQLGLAHTGAPAAAHPLPGLGQEVTVLCSQVSGCA